MHIFGGHDLANHMKNKELKPTGNFILIDLLTAEFHGPPANISLLHLRWITASAAWEIFSDFCQVLFSHDYPPLLSFLLLDSIIFLTLQSYHTHFSSPTAPIGRNPDDSQIHTTYPDLFFINICNHIWGIFSLNLLFPEVNRFSCPANLSTHTSCRFPLLYSHHHYPCLGPNYLVPGLVQYPLNC